MTKALDGALGASMGARSVRTALVSNDGSVRNTALIPVPHTSVPAHTAAFAAHEQAARWHQECPVLAVDDADDPYAIDGVRLVSTTDALLAALRVTGLAADARVICAVDLGATGTSVHVLDAVTGRVLSTRRTTEISGDAWDTAVVDHLLTTYGARENYTPQSIAYLESDAVVTKELLSTEKAVDLSGPFVSETVRMRRTDLDAVLAPSLRALSVFVSPVLTEVDAVLLVGGGANIPAVVAAVQDSTSKPVLVPERPEGFAALGAAQLAFVIPIRTTAFGTRVDGEAVTAARGMPVVPAALPLNAAAQTGNDADDEIEESSTDRFEKVPALSLIAAAAPAGTAAAATTTDADRHARPGGGMGGKTRVAAYAATCAVVAMGAVLSLTAASARSESMDRSAGPVAANDASVQDFPQLARDTTSSTPVDPAAPAPEAPPAAETQTTTTTTTVVPPVTQAPAAAPADTDSDSRPASTRAPRTTKPAPTSTEEETEEAAPTTTRSRDRDTPRPRPTATGTPTTGTPTTITMPKWTMEFSSP